MARWPVVVLVALLGCATSRSVDGGELDALETDAPMHDTPEASDAPEPGDGGAMRDAVADVLGADVPMAPDAPPAGALCGPCVVDGDCPSGPCTCGVCASEDEDCDDGIDRDCDEVVDEGCGTCGNGVVEPGETCDPPASCPSDCDDGAPCSADELRGSAATCDAECVHSFRGNGASCEDGLYCNGVERCGPIGCESTSVPCPSLAACDESARRCVPCLAAAESCNALDDDCDGAIDEAGCVFEPVVPESCNALDDDFDARIDESTDGDPCGADVGSCRPGTTRCACGRLLCVGGRRAEAERCDGTAADEDCDGLVDEGCSG